MNKEDLKINQIVYGTEKKASFIGKIKELLEDTCTIYPLAITTTGLKRWWNLNEPINQRYETIIGIVDTPEMFDEYHDTITKTPIELEHFIALASKELAKASQEQRPAKH